MYRVYLPILIPNILYRLGLFFVLKYRLLRYGYTYRLIRLGRGKYTKVDPEDYEWLSKYDWNIRIQKTNQYAFRMDDKRAFFIHMHREIMFNQNYKSQISNYKFKETNRKLLVDHINGDGLDNRKANLRVVTRQQNNYNTKPRRGKYTSKYKGVHWNKVNRKWQSELRYNGKKIYLGRFDDEVEAAKARDRAAKKYHGEFAWLNFPDD